MIRKQIGPNTGSLGRINVFGSEPKSRGMGNDSVDVDVIDAIAHVPINHKDSETVLVVTVA